MYQKVKFNIFYFIFNFTIIQKTLLSCPCLQIVSLGAGFDTLFFALSREGLLKDTKYFEVSYMQQQIFFYRKLLCYVYSQISLNLHIYRVDISLPKKTTYSWSPSFFSYLFQICRKSFGPMVGLFFSEADKASEVETFLFLVSIILPVAWEWLEAYLSSPVKTIQNNK